MTRLAKHLEPGDIIYDTQGVRIGMVTGVSDEHTDRRSHVWFTVAEYPGEFLTFHAGWDFVCDPWCPLA